MAKAAWKRHQWTLARVASLLAGLSSRGKALKVSQIQERYGVGIRELMALTRLLGGQEDTSVTAWNYIDLRLDYNDSDELVIGSTGAAALEALTRLAREDLVVAAEALDSLALPPKKRLAAKRLARHLVKAAQPLPAQRAIVYRPSESRQEQKKLVLLSLGEEEKRVVTFDYYGAGAHSKGRRVCPLVLRRDQGLWRLLAFDQDRKARRVFRVDHMRGIRVSQEHFEWPTDIDPARARGQDLGQFKPGGGEVKVKMKVDGEVYRAFKAAFDAKVTRSKDGSVSGSLKVPSAAWLVQTFRPYAGQVKVLAPADMARAWKAELDSIRAIYR